VNFVNPMNFIRGTNGDAGEGSYILKKVLLLLIGTVT
jgi:hypothetical protein